MNDDIDDRVLGALRLNVRTRALLAALRDLHDMKEWLRSGEDVDLTEMTARAQAVREATTLWCDEGCPDAPPSVDELADAWEPCLPECIDVDGSGHALGCPNESGR